MLNIIFFEIQIAIIFSLGKGKEKIVYRRINIMLDKLNKFMHFNKAYTWRAACKGHRRQCIREFIVKMSLIWAWYFFPIYILFFTFMVKSHIFAMLWLLFIRCLQIENAIGFLSQITIYIFRGCQILFWNKLNQNDMSVRSLYINYFFKLRKTFFG